MKQENQKPIPALIVLIITVLVMASLGCAPAVSADDDDGLITVAGILTQDPTTREWLLTNDAGHETYNIARVDTEADGLLITFRFDASKVVTFVVTGDASYAERGFTFGGQIGTHMARVWYGAPMPGGYRRVTTAEAFVENSNIMVYGVFKK